MKKIIALSLSVLFLAGCSQLTSITNEEAKTITGNFIKNVLAPGAVIEIKSVEKDAGLFKVTVEAQGQDIASYLSADGKIFFPQALNISELEEKAAEMKKAQEEATTPKTEEEEKEEVAEESEVSAEAEEVMTDETEKTAE